LTASATAGGFIAAGLAGLFITQKQETITEKGEIRRLPMSDGSIATINTDTKIKIAMTQTARQIDLVRGEVWFKVAKNKARPFIVTAGLARIQAVGTAFSVRRRGDGAEVLVTEGTVKVWADGAEQPPMYLNAGDRTVIAQKTKAKVEYVPQVVDSALAWRSGQIDLSGQTLFDAAEEFNRYNQKKIIIEDSDLGHERLVGRMSTDDPEGFSKAVALAFDAEATQADNKIYIGVKKK
jgi:transmembrane sensor